MPPPAGTDEASGNAVALIQSGDAGLVADSFDEELARTYGLSGPNAFASPRDTRLRSAFANQSAAGRQGAISETYFGTGRGSLYGFGAIDQNRRTPAHPRTDFRMLFGDQVDVSVKSRVPDTAAFQSGSLVEQYHNYLEGHARLLDMDPSYRGFQQFMAVSAQGRTPAEVRAQSGLAVDASDFEGYRNLLADPLSSSGGASDTPNYQRSAVSRIYDGILQDNPIVVGDGGQNLRTVAEINSALNSGRIGIMQHTAMLNQLGASASAQVLPNVGFGAQQARGFQQAFAGMHPSLRPAPPPAPASAQRFTASRRTDTARAGSASRIEQFDSYLRNQAEMFASGGQLLHVDPADVPSYQSLLRDPFARETTPGGGASPRRNYQRADMTRVYDGVLASNPVRSDAGQEYRTIADIDQALANGQLTAREHYQLVDRVGRMAARSVAPDIPTPTSAADTAARAQYDAARARANEYIRRVASPEYMHSVSHGGGARGDLHAAGTYGGRAGLFGVLIGGGMEAWSSRDRGFDDPETWNRIAKAGGREGLRSTLSSSLETVAASRTSNYLLREGLETSAARSLAMRGAARTVPGGAVDVGFEVFDMATDDRENAADEVTYRLGRSFVIGAASTAAGGAAAGALAGSVVPGLGTVVGFIVGAAVGFLLSEGIPRWDELQQSGDSHDAFHDRYGNRVMFRSEFNRYVGEGRCVPGHHTTIRVMEDPPGLMDRPSLLPMMYPQLGVPTDPNAHTAPQPLGWQQQLRSGGYGGNSGVDRIQQHDSRRERALMPAQRTRFWSAATDGVCDLKAATDKPARLMIRPRCRRSVPAVRAAAETLPWVWPSSHCRYRRSNSRRHRAFARFKPPQ